MGPTTQSANSLATKVIIDELIARPGQSKYLLASHIHVSPIELETELDTLLNDGLVVQSADDGEPLLWASNRASR